jgi:hypothetical protein
MKIDLYVEGNRGALGVFPTTLRSCKFFGLSTLCGQLCTLHAVKCTIGSILYKIPERVIHQRESQLRLRSRRPRHPEPDGLFKYTGVGHPHHLSVALPRQRGVASPPHLRRHQKTVPWGRALLRYSTRSLMQESRKERKYGW